MVQGGGWVSSLMARWGCGAMALVVAAMGVWGPWKSRMRLMARFLRAAEIKGPLRVRSWWRSSPVTMSLIQWRRFSMSQWSRV